MKLNDEMLAQYLQDGFVTSDAVFAASEVIALTNAFARDCRDTDGPHLIQDDRTGEALAMYAPHQRLAEYRDLVHDPRIVDPVRQLLQTDDVYVYQCKINNKAPLEGEKWSWHQDYAAWRLADELPAPSLVNVAVFLDDMTEFNGPLVFIPGSHRDGTTTVLMRSGSRSERHVDPNDIALSQPVLARMVERSGMRASKGAAGTTVFFSPEIVHGSANNISPYPRRLLIITFNDVANLPARSADRPEYLVGRPTTSRAR